MGEHQVQKVPLPSIRRYPLYLRLLKAHLEEGEKWISSTEIARVLNLKPIQVRKDMACTGIGGKPRIGFALEPLIFAIEQLLGWDNATDAILVGAGNLGSALTGYHGFDQYGLKIAAVFDNSPEKIGTMINGVRVFAMGEMPEMVSTLSVRMAVLTVPAEHAQEVALSLVNAGILGIWNFSVQALNLPSHIIVQRTDLAVSFAELSARLIKEIRKKT